MNVGPVPAHAPTSFERRRTSDWRQSSTLLMSGEGKRTKFRPAAWPATSASPSQPPIAGFQPQLNLSLLDCPFPDGTACCAKAVAHGCVVDPRKCLLPVRVWSPPTGSRVVPRSSGRAGRKTTFAKLGRTRQRSDDCPLPSRRLSCGFVRSIERKGEPKWLMICIPQLHDRRRTPVWLEFGPDRILIGLQRRAN